MQTCSYVDTVKIPAGELESNTSKREKLPPAAPFELLIWSKLNVSSGLSSRSSASRWHILILLHVELWVSRKAN
jgi:hypothetical protein